MTELDLSKFCDREPCQYAIDEPFAVNGMTYATDGRILIRVPVELCAAAAPTGKVPPNCDSILAPHTSVREWHALPDIVDCELCEGIGRYVSTCALCHGTGLVRDGNTISSCEECGDDCSDGLGCYCESVETVPCSCNVAFANSWYGQWYLNLLRTLPEAKIGVVNESEDATLYFTFAGGCGCLMPLKKSDGHRVEQSEAREHRKEETNA